MRRREPTPKATVVVEVDNDFLGQTYKYDSGGHKHPEVTLINKYAEVFVNSNGKPEELGKLILQIFSPLEDNDDEYELRERVYKHLVAEGNCSIFGEPIYDKYKNNWAESKPTFSGSLPEIKEDYQYLFSNDEWFVRSEVDDTIYDFTKLTDVVKLDEEE